MKDHQSNSRTPAACQEWLGGDYTPGLVSVLIPTYNRVALLPETLESILNQTYDSVEVVVVDDGSTDATSDVLRYWEERFRTQRGWVLTPMRQENAGAPSARNRAAAASHGQWLKFFDDDDLLARDTIATEAAALANSSAQVAYSPHAFFVQRDSDYWVGSRQNKSGSEQSESNLQGFLNGWDWALQAALLRRDLVAQVGPWKTDLLRGQDLDYKIRLLEAHAIFQFAPSAGVFVRRHENSVSHNRNPRAYQQLLGTLAQLESIALNEIDRDDMCRPMAQRWLQRAMWFYQDGAYSEGRECERRAAALDPHARFSTPGLLNQVTARLVGLRGVGTLSRYRKRLGHWLFRLTGRRPGSLTRVAELPLTAQTPRMHDTSQEASPC